MLVTDWNCQIENEDCEEFIPLLADLSIAEQRKLPGDDGWQIPAIESKPDGLRRSATSKVDAIMRSVMNTYSSRSA